MLLLVGLLSVGPLCAEVVCSDDDCAREVMVFRGSTAEAPAHKAVARAIGSVTSSARVTARRAFFVETPATQLAFSSNGAHVPLRM
jgi:hypothetical protein